MTSARREATPTEARALANPIRLRILRLLRFDSLTNAELAARLQMNPATTLHHVRTLLRSGFVETDDERPGPNGITEKPYRDTGKSWVVNVSDPSDGEALAAASLEAFVAEIGEVGGEVVSTTRQALRLDDAGLAELTARLLAVFDEFEERGDDDGDAYAVFTAIHRRPE